MKIKINTVWNNKKTIKSIGQQKDPQLVNHCTKYFNLPDEITHFSKYLKYFNNLKRPRSLRFDLFLNIVTVK